MHFCNWETPNSRSKGDSALGPKGSLLYVKSVGSVHGSEASILAALRPFLFLVFIFVLQLGKIKST